MGPAQAKFCKACPLGKLPTAVMPDAGLLRHPLTRALMTLRCAVLPSLLVSLLREVSGLKTSGGQRRVPRRPSFLHACTASTQKALAIMQMPVQAHMSAFAAMSLQSASSSGSSGQGSGQGPSCRRLQSPKSGVTTSQDACNKVRTACACSHCPCQKFWRDVVSCHLLKCRQLVIPYRSTDADCAFHHS